MHGPEILVNTITDLEIPDQYGNLWQYHSRSDRHSVIACWGVAFDLLATSSLLPRHVADGKVVMGVNQKLVDYSTKREKKLDLVIARAANRERSRTSLATIAAEKEIQLTTGQRRLFNALPPLHAGTVNDQAILLALEAKATMTAHQRALPRLYDELNSSHLCVHGASRQALAIGLGVVNIAETFMSSDLNKRDLSQLPPIVSRHKQPGDVEKVLRKYGEIPRRSNNRENGFDGFGAIVVHGANNGERWHVVAGAPAPAPGTTFAYESMIHRMANEYDTSFTHI